MVFCDGLDYRYIHAYSGDSTQLTYLRARHYASDTGRFLTRDTWGGNANSPMSYNRWIYVNGNPINFIDPSGHYPESTSEILSNILPHYSSPLGTINIVALTYDCSSISDSLPSSDRDRKHYDLTWWLALAMSRHAADARVTEIATMIDSAHTDVNLSLTARLALVGAGYLKFNNLEGAWKEWDVKRKMLVELKLGVVLCGTTCDWFDYSTPGNIHFGFIAYRAKIHHGVAAVLGGLLEQKDALEKEHRLYPDYCSQNASQLFCDNPQDQAAVDFGYMLAEKYENIPTITEKMLRSELTATWLAKFQRPPSGFIPPHPARLDLWNDYSADHFNN